MASFEDLVKTMEHLRSPDGCAWDRKQKISDFTKYLAEESQEAIDAIKAEDMENLCEELGDLMWHILFISQVAKEEGKFTINDVMGGLHKKMIRRHPHVFGECDNIESAEEVERRYAALKASEKGSQDI